MARRGLLGSILATLGLGASKAEVLTPIAFDRPAPAAPRQSYEQSIIRLMDVGLLSEGDAPSLPARTPRYDDEAPLGVEFFRTEVSDEDLSNLTLPRTFFGRSSLERVSFRNTDLSESSLCWNDLVGVDFSGASLARCDARASRFAHVDFRNADLSGADLRHSSFDNCRFDDARMDGVALMRNQLPPDAVSPEQAATIRWKTDAGPEPDGG